jgi:signal transduction histidine kinase/CheY-like chemotaxis protein
MADYDIFSTFIPEGNETGALIRSIDWSKTPVGPVSQWPQTLKTSLANMLACRFPMYVAWGDEFTAFYNDAYCAILGTLRHPHAMGIPTKDSWPDIWDKAEPLFKNVMETGHTTGFDDFPFVMTRKGFPEESYLTFSWSAIPDEFGKPAGILAIVFETTDRVNNEKINQELRQSELLAQSEVELARQELNDFVMQAPTPMVVLLGPEHRFSVANPAYERMVGRKVVGKSVLEAFNIGEVGDFVRLLDGVYQSGIDYIGIEFPLSIPDETGVIHKRFLNITYKAFCKRDGEIKGVLAIHHDVTEQVLARKELETSKAELATEQIKFETVFRESPVAMALFRGSNHVFELANPAYRAFFSEREFVGKALLDAIPELHDQGFVPLLTNVLETGEPYFGKEVVARHSRVSNGPLENRVYDFTYVRLNGPDGNPYGVYVHAIDVTDKTKVRKALEESERRLLVEQKKFKAIFYSSAAPMVLLRGPEFIYEMVNSRYTELLPQRELLGKTLLEVSPEVAQSQFPDLLKQVYETGNQKSTLGGMTPIFNPVTELFENRYFDVTYARIDDGDDKPTAIFAYSAEVTARIVADKELERGRQELAQALLREKEARAEAEKGNLAKDLFLATLSHELRTPLTSILSWAQLLRSGKLDIEKSDRAYKIIESSAKAQGQLISDLLDVSRAIMGKLPIEISEIHPASIIQAAIETIRPSAEGKSINFNLIIGQIVGVAFADPIRLQQVIWNLLTNAIKFSEVGSEIEVSLNQVDLKSKPYFQIKVIDTGKGIPHDFLPRIFEKFSQVDSTSTRVHGGLGLGLAIVRNLVELQGGTVEAESLGIGKGSTFTVTLPLSDPTSVSKSAHAAHQVKNCLVSTSIKENEWPLLNGIRILVVDDEDYPREAFCELLKSWGAVVRVAASAAEALIVFSEFKPQILVSDIGMPGEDGYSLIRKIREREVEFGQTIWALALTAYASGEDVDRAISAGFQAHLAKPVDSVDLARVIASFAQNLGV